MTLRTLIFWPHLIAGILAGAIILIMSVTGVLLTYERQMIAWSDSHLASTPPAPGAQRLPVETLIATVRAQHPDLVPTAVTIGSAPTAAAVFAVPQRTLHVDTYSGALLGEGSQGMRQAMSDLRSWHRWLAVTGDGRPLARAITGWSNVLFLFVVVSGMYLWLPRKWSWVQVRQISLFRGGLRGKARDFNWHNVLGIWSAIPLFIVVISAVPISFPWGNALVYRAVGEEPPAQGGRGGGREGGARQGGAREGGPREGGARGEQRDGGDARPGGDQEAPPLAGLNQLWARAEQQVPGWRTINLRLPESDRAPVVFAIDGGDGGQPHLRSTLTLDRRSGDVVSYESFGTLTLGRRIRNTMRFAHTGEVLGIPGQTVAGLATFASVVLVWTGIALALRRFTAWTRRRRDAGFVPASRENAA
jgi:uncharacterized iron-regulated membrane protein